MNMEKERLYDSIKDMKDDYTRKVLYSQFIHKYYPVALDAIITLAGMGEVHKNKETIAPLKENKQ